MKITLNQILNHHINFSDWGKLIKSLGKTCADDAPLTITQILDSVGLDGALWCLRFVDGYDKEIGLYAVWCAKQVQHLLKDDRSIEALEISEKYSHNKLSQVELRKARHLAWLSARFAYENNVNQSELEASRCVYWAIPHYGVKGAAQDAARNAAHSAQKATNFDIKVKTEQEFQLRLLCSTFK